MGNFLQELRRRNVVRVVGAYLVVGWLLVQIATTLEESMQLPAWFDGVVVGLLIVGLPIAIIVSWVFDMTADGVVRTDAATTDTQYQSWRKLDYVIIASVLIVGLVFAWQWFSASDEPTSAVTDASTPAPVSAATIAVLPFADLSPAGDQEYFSDGISEEILNLLAGVEALDVTSRTSAFQFKGRDLGIPEIATNLKVRHVVEGSVRKAGETLRITAQLIDAEQDRHLWSDTFDRPLTAENIFAIQDEISKAIVTALGEELGFNGSAEINVRASTDNLTAYDLFLKARSLYRARVELDYADELLAAAVEQDPTFAAAWEMRAALQFLMEGYGFNDKPQEEIVRLTDEFADRALALEPNSSIAIASKAYVHLRDAKLIDSFVDIAGVHDDLARALEISPRNYSALNWRGLARLTVGDISGSLEDFSACLEVEPLSAPCAENYVTVLAGSGRDEEAFAFFQTMLNRGMVKPRETDLPLLARMGAETAFKVAANDVQVLFGWREIDQLYDALRRPDDDHSQLAHSMKSFLKANPGRGEIATKIILAHIGDYPEDLNELIFWQAAQQEMRQTDLFRQFIRQSGVLYYWQERGFPPQCRAVGEDDFACD